MLKCNFKVKTEVEDNYVGDFSAIIASMRNLRLEISNTILSIDEASEQVSMGAEQLAASAQTLAESTTEQAGAIEEITATVESVSEMANEISNKADVAYSVASDTAKHAADSQKDLIELTDAMEKITYTSQEIANIIGSIEDIASQTNLLSLNASIEAARAGEAGKGFAVVADEIRHLSEQSSEAADNIHKIINGLSGMTDEVSNRVNAGAESANDVVSKMDTLVNVLTGINDSTEVAHDLVREQYKVIESVRTAFDSVNSDIQTLVATSEENAAMISNISESIRQQEEAVSNVDDGIEHVLKLSGELKEHFN